MYGDFIHELDWIVGGVVQAVDKRGDTDNTLIIFTSDNGGMLNVTGQRAWRAGHRLNGILLGFKFGAWEGGHRIPFIAKWPGKIPANTTSNHLISQIDLLATFSTIAGIKLDSAKNPDSINQLPEFLGKTKRPLRQELLILCNSPKHMAIRTQKWLFIDAQGEGGFDAKKWGQHLLGGAAALKYTKQINSDVVNGKIKPGAPNAQLYDLEKDISQTINAVRNHPQVVKKLRQRLLYHRKNTGKGKRIGWISPN